MTETYHGKPCKRGGHTERHVSTQCCVVCKKADNKKWRTENSDYNKIWQAENPRLCNHRTVLRQARKKQQTPKWADLEKIKEIYLNCPKGYEVDHIHPLSRGGLHVDYNLQYLTPYENKSKGAKLDYE